MLWQAVVTGLLLSADAWVAGAVYGREGIRTGWFAPLLGAGMSAAAFLAAGSCSEAAERLLGAGFCRWLGAGVLLALGLHALLRNPPGKEGHRIRGKIGELRFLLELTVDQEQADLDRSRSLSPKEGLLLGAAMSLDAAGAGLGADPELLAAAISVFLATLAALTLGPLIGRRLPEGGKWLGGLCLIVMAILRLF